MCSDLLQEKLDWGKCAHEYADQANVALLD
jgi:hypothetical protein